MLGIWGSILGLGIPQTIAPYEGPEYKSLVLPQSFLLMQEFRSFLISTKRKLFKISAFLQTRSYIVKVSAFSFVDQSRIRFWPTCISKANTGVFCGPSQVCISQRGNQISVQSWSLLQSNLDLMNRDFSQSPP